MGKAGFLRTEPSGKAHRQAKKETAEQSLADTKQLLHGHPYARLRGLTPVQQQRLLAATAQNIKKIALPMSRNGSKMPLSALQVLLSADNGQLLPCRLLLGFDSESD